MKKKKRRTMNDRRKTKLSASENKEIVGLTDYSEKPDLNSASKRQLMKVRGIEKKLQILLFSTEKNTDG